VKGDKPSNCGISSNSRKPRASPSSLLGPCGNNSTSHWLRNASLEPHESVISVRLFPHEPFESHTVDGWVLAASVSGATKPMCTRLWYMVPAVLHRRQLHRLQASKGGKRKPYGGTRSLGLKRGTLVRHSMYGYCTVGGFDRKRSTISLHAYRTNKRLTQGAKIKDCRLLTWMAFLSWLVAEKKKQFRWERGHPFPNPKQGTPASSPYLKDEGYPQAEDLMKNCYRRLRMHASLAPYVAARNMLRCSLPYSQRRML